MAIEFVKEDLLVVIQYHFIITNVFITSTAVFLGFNH